MASHSISVIVPEPLTAYVEARVDEGSFGTPTEYVRELILEERDRRMAGLEDRLIEAAKGPFVELTDEEWLHGDIMAIAEHRLRQVE